RRARYDWKPSAWAVASGRIPSRFRPTSGRISIAQPIRKKKMPSNDGHIAIETLAPFFNPETVAIIGASSDPTKIGGRPIQYMKITGYKGRVCPVNPNYPE